MVLLDVAASRLCALGGVQRSVWGGLQMQLPGSQPRCSHSSTRQLLRYHISSCRRETPHPHIVRFCFGGIFWDLFVLLFYFFTFPKSFLCWWTWPQRGAMPRLLQAKMTSPLSITSASAVPAHSQQTEVSAHTGNNACTYVVTDAFWEEEFMSQLLWKILNVLFF